MKLRLKYCLLPNLFIICYIWLCQIQKNKRFLETVAVAAQAMGKTTEQRRQESLKRISSEVQELRQQLKRVKLDTGDADLDLDVSDGVKSCPQGDVQSKKETVDVEHLSEYSLQGESLQQLLKSCNDQRIFCQGIYGALIELVGEVGQLPREDNAMCIRQLYDFTKELQDQEKALFSKIEQACCQSQQSNDLQATQVKELDKWKRAQKEQVEGVEKLLLSLLYQGTVERRESHGKMEKSQVSSTGICMLFPLKYNSIQGKFKTIDISFYTWTHVWYNDLHIK